MCTYSQISVHIYGKSSDALNNHSIWQLFGKFPEKFMESSAQLSHISVYIHGKSVLLSSQLLVERTPPLSSSEAFSQLHVTTRYYVEVCSSLNRV